MKHAPAGPVVVLSPHLDDAVLSAWSVLRRDAPTTVVNICAGVPPSGPPPPWDRLTRATDAAERMHERKAEDREALAQAGRESIDLPFIDNHYRSGPLDGDALAAALAEAVPEVSELWAPAAVGGHSDHVAARDAALALARDGPPVHLYADLPYAARHGWPEWVTGRRPRHRLDLDGWLQSFLPAGAAYPGEAQALSRSEARRKLRAVRAYRTQWEVFESDGWMGRGATTRYEVSFPVPR